MNFFDVFWADGNIEKISIEYDKVVLSVKTVDEQFRTIVCRGVAGFTRICFWDDTIIEKATLKPVDGDEGFIKELYSVYNINLDYGMRSLKDLFYELKIDLVNKTSFCIYCQHIFVK